jgi:hypothetical protein
MAGLNLPIVEPSCFQVEVEEGYDGATTFQHAGLNKPAWLHRGLGVLAGLAGFMLIGVSASVVFPSPSHTESFSLASYINPAMPAFPGNQVKASSSAQTPLMQMSSRMERSARANTLPLRSEASRSNTPTMSLLMGPEILTRAGAPIVGLGASQSASAQVAPAGEPLATMTTLIAKSKADLVLDDIFIYFPIVLGGALLTGFAIQLLKPRLPEGLTQAYDELPGGVQFVVLLGGGGAFFVLTKIGLLGGVAGFVAKGALDAWNLFATTVLPGAILRY